MKLVADECVPVIVIAMLREAGHEIVAIRDLAPGAPDEAVLRVAVDLDDSLLTEDLDFGEMVFRQSMTSAGVIMLRLLGLANAQRAAILVHVLREHFAAIPGAIVVVTPGAVRIRQV